MEGYPSVIQLEQTWNPLDTMHPTGAVGNWNKAGVKIYPNLQAGVEATARTLEQDNFSNLRETLRTQRVNKGTAADLQLWGWDTPNLLNTILEAMGAPYGTVESGGVPMPRAPLTADAEVTEPGDIPMPKLSDYVDEYSGRTDWEGYYLALDARQKLMAGGEPGTELIDYMDTAIARWSTEILGGQLDVARADVELSKRLGALEEAGRTYRELAPYSLPEGAKWIPGGEPGGLYEQMGMGTMPAQTTYINPLASALAAMGRTPEMGATPEMTPEALLAEAQRLQGAVAPPAAPLSHLEAALATAGAPAAPPVEDRGPVGPAFSETSFNPPVEPGQMGIFQLVLAMAAAMGERAEQAGLEMPMSEDDKIRLGKILQQIIGKDVELSEWMAQPAGATWDVLRRIRP